MLRDHGQPQKYHHDVIGWNGRMDGIQGAVLSVKLKYLDKWNEARRANAKKYDRLLAGVARSACPSRRTTPGTSTTSMPCATPSAMP